MEYNIDILVAGCNTRCAHCYVDGGPEKAMTIEDFNCCMEKLKPVFSYFQGRCNFTLDNEVYNHKDALSILQKAFEFPEYYHHGSTTGIALLHHPKRDEIISLIKKTQFPWASIALHAGSKVHNELVNHPKAMEDILAITPILKEAGIEIWLSLMLTKYLLADLNEMDQLLDQIPYDHLLPVIPSYYPTARLIKYQDARLNKEEYGKIISFLKNRNADVKEIEKACMEYNELSLLEHPDEYDIEKMLKAKNAAFFHIDHQLDFYVGNTGIKLRKCGNIKECSSQEIIEWIQNADDNWYETSILHYQDLIEAVKKKELKRSKENYVYNEELNGILAMAFNAKRSNL